MPFSYEVIKIEDIINAIFTQIAREPTKTRYYDDAFEAIKILAKKDKEKAFKHNATLRQYIEIAKSLTDDIAFLRVVENIRKETYHLEARDIFDSYLIYLEWNRPAKKKFYLPRRRVLKPLADALQDLSEKKIKFLGVSLPPRVGKSTLCIFFMTWILGKRPNEASAMAGYSDDLITGFYQEVLSVIADNQKYLWNEVFPEVTLANTSAKKTTIDLNSKKRFSSLTCRSIEGAWTGGIEVSENGILYCDDLVKGLEEALNPDTMNKLYNTYLNVAKDRMKDGAVELMVGTRWNVYDPLGRTQEAHKDDPLYRFIVIPAMDDNDESNFVYDYGLGFSTEYYRNMRNMLQPADWWAKYMGRPYVREGLLFPVHELKYYDELPHDTPDRKVAFIDVAWGGGDYLSMPVGYVYKKDGEDEVYIEDVVFSKGDKDATIPKVVGKIRRHLPYTVQLEANNGGNEYKDKIEELLLRENIHINVSARRCPTTSSKMQRIYQYSSDIKKFYFKSPRTRDIEYQLFMDNLNTFVMEGKNKNDDAPDSLAGLVTAIFNTYGKVTVFERPF